MVSQSHVPLYLGLIGFECALVLGVRALAARGGQSLETSLGRRPVPVDTVIAAAMWLTWMGVAWGINTWLPHSTGKVVGSMLPAGIVESAIWVLLSISAGIAEELMFRGYLQRRIGIVGQAIVFGIVHG